MSRSIFSNDEKRCLQELIVKYKLNTSITYGAGNYAAKKNAWEGLTNEFNAIETNTKRTEAQLKKCFDNMKTRRKAELTAQKRERMRTGGGPYRPSPEPSTSAQDSMLVDGDVLAELTDVEMAGAIDSDSVIPSTGSQEESVVADETHTVFVVVQNQTEESREVHDEEVQTESLNLSTSEAQPGIGQSRSGDRRASSRQSESDRGGHGSGGRNIRVQTIQKEFSLREESYKRAQDREAELHRLKVAEQEWLVKAAEEIYKKACIEREAAQLVLDSLKNK